MTQSLDNVDDTQLGFEFQPPSSFWQILEAVRSAPPVRLGVIVIRTANATGRIGVFSNTSISGAVIEESGTTGINALRLLCAQPAGQFGLRSAEGRDSVLGQSLSVDIDQMLKLRADNETMSAETALMTVRGLIPPPPPKPKPSPGEMTAALLNAHQPPPPITDPIPVAKTTNQIHNSTARQRALSSVKVDTKELSGRMRALTAEELSADDLPEKVSIPVWVCPTIIGVVLIALGLGFMVVHQQIEVDDLIGKAQSGLHDNHLDDAMFALNKAIGMSPKNARAHFYRALVFARQGQDTEALADFDVARGSGMAKDTVELPLASTLCKFGDYKRALKLATVMIQRQPNDGRLYLIKGTCEAHTEAPDEAVQDFGKAISLSKEPETKAHAYFERAMLMLQKHDRKSAQDDVTQAISVRGDANEYQLAGDIKRDDKQWKEACDLYSKAIESDKHATNAFLSRGICYSRLDDKDKALADFNEALRLDSGCVEALIQRGTVYLDTEAYEKAFSDFKRALKLCPNLGEVQLKLAKVKEHVRE